MSAERAVVQYEPSRIDLAVDEAMKALPRDRNIYTRAGSLAFVTRATAEDTARFPGLAKESPLVRILAAPTLVERLCSLVRFEAWKPSKKGEGEWIAKPPPMPVVSAILARGMWPGVVPLLGILETPTIRPLSQKCEVVTRKGYDHASGYLYLPPHGITFPEVKPSPTRDDARAALAALQDVFVDFPFERPEGRSVAIAAVLTMIARPAIPGNTPVFGLDATTPGTGKGLVVDVIHEVATGRTVQKPSCPEDRNGVDNAELRKLLDSVALRGAPSLVLDNFKPGLALGGSALEAILTSGRHGGRILGRSEDFNVPWVTVIFATGNNITTTGDMQRRTLIARMASPYEKPEHRPADSYVHPERAGSDRLLAWAAAERPRLVHAALTLLRAYGAAGAPSCVKEPGSFEPWARLIAGAIVWAGGPDPLACMLSAQDTAEPADVGALRTVLRDLPRLDERGTGLTMKEILGFLYPAERVRGEHVAPDGYDELRAALEELAPPRRLNAPPDNRELGNRLAGLRGRILGGAALEHAAQAARGGVARWTVQQAPAS